MEEEVSLEGSVEYSLWLFRRGSWVESLLKGQEVRVASEGVDLNPW